MPSEISNPIPSNPSTYSFWAFKPLYSVLKQPKQTKADQCRPRQTKADKDRPRQTKAYQGRPRQTKTDHGRPRQTKAVQAGQSTYPYEVCAEGGSSSLILNLQSNLFHSACSCVGSLKQIHTTCSFLYRVDPTVGTDTMKETPIELAAKQSDLLTLLTEFAHLPHLVKDPQTQPESLRSWSRRLIFVTYKHSKKMKREERRHLLKGGACGFQKYSTSI